MSASEQCPHCDRGVVIPQDRLQAHIAEAHADLPPCTARISNSATEHVAVDCAFRAGHHDDLGDDHAGPYDPTLGRLRWADRAVGAVPHIPGPDETRPKEPPTPSGLDELRADNEALRYQIRRAREALGIGRLPNRCPNCGHGLEAAGA